MRMNMICINEHDLWDRIRCKVGLDHDVLDMDGTERMLKKAFRGT